MPAEPTITRPRKAMQQAKLSGVGFRCAAAELVGEEESERREATHLLIQPANESPVSSRNANPHQRHPDPPTPPVRRIPSHPIPVRRVHGRRHHHHHNRLHKATRLLEASLALPLNPNRHGSSARSALGTTAGFASGWGWFCLPHHPTHPSPLLQGLACLVSCVPPPPAMPTRLAPHRRSHTVR